MELTHYKEMVATLGEYKKSLYGKKVFVFGHCEASLTLIDLLIENHLNPVAILDNSKAKHGIEYRDIKVVPPEMVLSYDSHTSVVLIATRFYEAMNAQLRGMGFGGSIIKLVDYNTYAEYSLSEETVKRKLQRLEYGIKSLETIKDSYRGAFIIFCPFNALGDVYFTMSYLPAFLKKMGKDECVICVPSDACAKVVRLFGNDVQVMEQKELDASIQAVIYTQDVDCFIAHQDRPYVVNLHRALQIKPILLETIYCCGVFGLPKDTLPYEPAKWKIWNGINEIESGKVVVLSPYAKSVVSLPDAIWTDIVSDYSEQGYQIYTNVSGEEIPIVGTKPLRVELCEMKSVLEKAGTFIGIRSGLCDVIRTVNCKKIALYPDYNYCDTKWKAIDIYRIDGFENIVVKEGDTWEIIKEQIH